MLKIIVMPKGLRYDLTGKRLGSLVVISREPTQLIGKKTSAMWKCRCDCGVVKVIRAQFLTRKIKPYRSCGCKIGLVIIRNNMPVQEAYYNYWKTSCCRGKEININYDTFLDLVTSNCYYCGIEPYQVYTKFFKKGEAEFKHTGIDRVDNNKGYVDGNCVPCCEVCNRMKLTMTQEVFYKKVEDIYNVLQERLHPKEVKTYKSLLDFINS